MADEKLLLQMTGIDKSFPGVHALQSVHFDLRRGEVHALLGENGAGKSTLIKILGGIYQKDKGEILVNGEKVTINSVEDARKAGVSIIHQELVLVPWLSIAENMFLGREPLNKLGLVDYGKMNREAKKYLVDFGLDLDPLTPIAKLNIAQQQMVEIVKAISFSSNIVVMDEPTSSLSDKEAEALFESIRKLKARGVGIIYISHRMSELNIVADRVTVLRDGQYVATKNVKESTTDDLIALMVGRSMTNYYTRTYNNFPETALKVEGLTTNRIHDVSFEAKRGEILGFAGLIGCGRSETMEAIFGLDKIKSGTIELYGKKISGMKPDRIIKEGIGLVPEDRRGEGMFGVMDIKFNATLKVLDEFIGKLHVNANKERKITQHGIDSLKIKTPTMKTPIASLSGGNQQKVIIASWLAAGPKVLIVDEPTRGIDVGAKGEIYEIMNRLAAEGVTILMVSSDLPEVLNMSDRIAVMCEGTISKILDRTEASQEVIMQYAVSM
ncbi:MAG: sugar ABC transporter ATP-binding protein [Subdoligranulum sp.]|nr:sugar ABC transporter ATP-binding protein [Subdoligranulum sp.]